MAMKIEVKKDIMIPAAENPEEHYHSWAVNYAYTSSDGVGMIMSTVRPISDGNDNWRQRRTGVQRWVSDDNAASWVPQNSEVINDSYQSKNLQLAWMNFRDPVNDKLLSFHQTSRRTDEGGRITPLFYEISSDAGKTWAQPRQVIHPDSEFDEIHWMPRVTDNKQYIGVDQSPFVKLDDGTIVMGFTVHPHEPDYPREQFYVGCIFLRGQWNEDNSELTWESSDIVQVPPDVSPLGACEPDLLYLGGQRLLTTMRCQGEEEPAGIFSSRQWAVSEDGGKTWSEPQMLRYEDGSMVCVPASLSAFERHPETNKAYWFANILDKPVTGQTPRYPLAMAQFDTEKFCLIKDSVAIIQDFPKGALANCCYSNFGHYVDRVTGEIVLTMAEKYKFNTKDFRADTIRFRIKIISD